MRIADVWVAVRTDMSDFRRGMAELNKNASASASAIGDTLSKAGASMRKTGSAMTASLTLPIAAVGAATSMLALDFDKALTKVVALTDVTAEEIGGVREEILKLAPAIGKSPQELAEAFYFLASAGFDAKESMEVLTVAASASAAGLGETQEVAKILGAVVNAYGEENITAARAADILVAAIGEGTAEAPEFAASLGQVVGSAAQVGAKFEDVAAATAAMTLTGLDAAESTVSLNQVLVTLMKPTTEGADALGKYGMSAAGLRQQIKDEGLLSVLQDLAVAFDGDAEATAAVFGNVRALRGVLALTGPAAAKTATVFQDVADSTGSLNEAVETYLASPSSKLNRDFAELQVALIKIGEDVLPIVVEVFSELADGASALADWWGKLDKGTREMVVRLLAFAAVAGPALKVLGLLSSGAGALLKGFGKLTGPQGIPTAATKLGLLGAAAGAASFGLLEGSKALGGWFRELQHGKAGARIIEDLAAVLQEDLGDLGGVVADQFVEWGVSAEEWARVLEAAGGDGIKALYAIKDAAGDTDAAFRELSGGATGMTQEWAEAWRANSTAVTTGLNGMLTSVKGTAPKIPVALVAALEDGAYEVGPAAEVMVDPIAEAMQKAIEDTATAGSDLIAALATELAAGPKEIRKELKALREALKDPYRDKPRREDIEEALGSKLLRDALTSSDAQTQALAAQQVTNWLAEYDLIAPGALERGELVNPALRRGIDRNYQALITYLSTTIVPGITDPFDLADVLDEMGYDAIAAYLRAMEQARLDMGTKAVNEIRRKTKADLFMETDAFGWGYNTVTAYGRGVSAATAAILPTHTQSLRNHMASVLTLRGSPPYYHAREWGEGVATNYMDVVTGTMRRLIPSLRDTMGLLQREMALQPAGMGAFGSVGRYEPTPSAVQRGGNTYDVKIQAPLREQSTIEVAAELRRAEYLGLLPDE